MEPPDTPTPRIFVGSMSDFYADRLHGVWIDPTTDVEAIEAEIQAMLKTAPDPEADEFAIFDYQGFGPVHLSQWEPLSYVHTIGCGIVQHGRAFAYWAHYLGTQSREMLDAFTHCYHGHWTTIDRFAIERHRGEPIAIRSLVPANQRTFAALHVVVLAEQALDTYVGFQDESGIYIFDA